MPSILLTLCCTTSAALAGESEIDFVRDIRPIFQACCVECHGPHKEKAGLRLDLKARAFAGAFEGKEPVLVPGKPLASLLYQRLVSTDDEERMPSGKKALDPALITSIKTWIEEGAVWPDDGSGAASASAPLHWAYVAPRDPPLPAVKHSAWCRSPFDRFVIARLEAEGLEPSPEAVRSTWLRRASLDLIGLPPAPERIAAFERDAEPDAYERAADQLLLSPHYGERQALWWLDLARYADTQGYEKDARRSMWPWRDWVIAAFNADEGFDQFTIEQLAGDLLPDATREQRIATGFQRNTLINEEGGADPDEFRHAAVVDRTNTMASVWLGSTLACCQCHNHKYDPFRQKDYYQLFAFFNDTTDSGGANEPVLSVGSAEQERERARLERRLNEIDALFAGDDETWDREQRQWLTEARARHPHQPAWTTLVPEKVSAQNGTQHAIHPDGVVLASGAKPEHELVELSLPHAPRCVRALRLECLGDPSLPRGLPGRSANGNFVLTGFEVEQRGVHVPIVAARADREQANGRFRIELAFDDDPASGWAGDQDAHPGPRTAVFVLAHPLEIGPDESLTVRLKQESPFAQHTLGAFRLSACDDDELVQQLTLPLFDGWFASDAQVVASTKQALVEADVENCRKLMRTGEPGQHLDPGLRALVGAARAWHHVNRFRCDEALGITLFLGADDGLRAWLDGRPIASIDTWEGDMRDERRVELDLTSGEHELCFTNVNEAGPGGFYFDARRRDEDQLPDDVAQAIAKEDDARSAEERVHLRSHFRTNRSARGRALTAERAKLASELTALVAQIPTTLVLAERAERRVTHIHIKGGYLAPGEVVEPDVPAVLPPLAADLPRNRLGLARWLVSPENPLTARVTVNRLWEHLFGHGIVATSEDFGLRGDLPTHPELLDWLALEFVRSGWSVKALLREIVLSATYRQSSVVTPELAERDPANALFARGPRLRLDGELLRDLALEASGLLNPELGGPSVFPPQPDGVWAVVYSQDRWMNAQDEQRHRRGLYTFWKRTSPYATFMLFDAPSRELSCTRRARSDTPLQALALLNDPAFVECAQGLARRMLREAATPEERVRRGFVLCTARQPDARELELLLGLYASERAALEREPALEARELEAWTRVASVLLNLDETLTKS